ncbi:5-oxoprolinase subunit PxpB [Neobacillus pocheonensis]|uniref:5-oxoprolinase subunit PxpB n=1 Tax=Neobacillus pocheonensis TaxID=363869 RepID=UPI003D27AA4A
MLEIVPLGDLALRVSFGNEINEAIHWEIQGFIAKLKAAKVQGIVEWVPTYNAVAIYYRPEIISFANLAVKVKEIYIHKNNVKAIHPIVFEIPVYYGGPDLSFIADYHQLSVDEVIAMHSNKEYLIYMMGFVPGFPYLGGLSPKLAVPRLEHPRPRVPAGSVGIGGNQTGIYPSEVPSGWRILGITPVKLFDLNNSSPILFSAGDYIKFYPIDEQEYARINQLVEENKFHVRFYKRGENDASN